LFRLLEELLEVCMTRRKILLVEDVEGSLDKLRNREIEVTPPRISQLVEAVDAHRDLSRRTISGDRALAAYHQRLLAAGGHS
jgi:hypothetical protein